MINELIDALENLQEAKAEYKKAAKNCQYDKSYFLYEEIKNVDKAKDELADIFKSAVTSVVIEIINNKSYLPI